MVNSIVKDVLSATKIKERFTELVDVEGLDTGDAHAELFQQARQYFRLSDIKGQFSELLLLIFCIPQIVTDLFELNLRQVAKKFGLLDIAVPELSGNDAARILNLAEEYSFKPSDEDRLLSLILCALVWKTEKKNGLHLNHLSEEY